MTQQEQYDANACPREPGITVTAYFIGDERHNVNWTIRPKRPFTRPILFPNTAVDYLKTRGINASAIAIK